MRRRGGRIGAGFPELGGMNAEWKGWALGAVVAVFAAVTAFLVVPAAEGEDWDPLEVAGPEWEGWTRWEGRAARPWGVEWVMRFEADSAWVMVAPAEPEGDEGWEAAERGWWAANAAGRALWGGGAVDGALRAAWHPQRHGVTELERRDGEVWSTFRAVDLEGKARPEHVTSFGAELAGAELPASWAAWQAAVRSGQIPNLLTARASRLAPTQAHPALCGRGNGTTLQLERQNGDFLTCYGWSDSTGISAEWRARGADWTDSIPWARPTPDGLLLGRGDWSTPPMPAPTARPAVDAWTWAPESGYAEAVRIGPGRLAWSHRPHAATPHAAAAHQHTAAPQPAPPHPTAPPATARPLGEVRNHRTGKPLAIRLESGTVKAYEGGREIWSVPIEGDLLGTAHEVDLYRNGKYQCAFATTRGVHLIDVLGREVKGFPVKPRQGVSAWLLADYDRNRKYRFLIATGDGQLLNYREEGQVTPGWTFKPTGTPIAHLAHLRVGSKDYLYAGQTDQHVRLLSRTGSDRATTPVQVPGEPAFRLGGSIAESTVLYIGADGWVEERTFGNNEPVGMTRRTQGTRVTVEDADRDGKPEIEVWDAAGNRTRWDHRNEPLEPYE